MGLFRKKEAKAESEELPELPNLPELTETQKINYKREAQSLPSFPDSEIGENLSKEAVKSAIKPQEFQEERQEIPILMPRTFPAKERKTVEISALPAKPINEESMLQPSILPSYSYPMQAPLPQQFSKKEPVYIRIDKFKSAVNYFNEIQSKVYEIESLLKKIKEIKQREDAELRDWGKEIEVVKARLGAIDNNIFSKLE